MGYKLYFLFIATLFFISCKDQRTNRPIAHPAVQDIKENIRIITSSLNLKDSMQVKRLWDTATFLVHQNPDSAIKFVNKALELSYQIKFTRGIAVGLLYTGAYFIDYKNDYKTADSLFRKALPYCHLASSENSKLFSTAYSGLARIYARGGQYDSSVYLYYKALELAQKMKKPDTTLLVNLNTSIGCIMGNVGQFDQARRYFNKAIELATDCKDTSALASIYFNMGVYYVHNKKEDSALYFYHQSLRLYNTQKGISAKKQIQNVYTYISHAWEHKGDRAKEKLYIDSAVAAYKEGVEQNYNLLIKLGYLHFVQSEFKEALPFYLQSLKFSEQKNLTEGRLNNYQALAAIYDTIGEGRLAYQYRLKYSDLKDSIVNHERLKTINDLEIQHRSAEKDKELAEKQLLIAHQQNRIQQQYLYIGAALIFIILLISLLYRRKHKAMIAQLKASLAGEEKERQRMAAELHDGIVSKLASVKMSFNLLSHTEGKGDDGEAFQEALELLEQSIVELRTTSQNLLPSILKKAGLALAVSIYCKKISKVAGIDIDFRLIGELPPLKEDFELNIYRIVQELVHNIVKHSGADQANVQMNVNDDLLSITVEDNGVGMPPEKLSSENGIGLFNLQSRLTLLNGTMEIVSRKGTSIYLEFDLKQFIARLK